MIFMDRDIWAEFMEASKYRNLGKTGSDLQLPPPPNEEPYDETKGIVELPAPSSINQGHVDLREVIEQRRSVRAYSQEPVTLEELSWLLWCSQGVQRVSERGLTLRTVPSAGSRHPFETLLLVSRVTGVEPGLYRYVASKHALVLVKPGAETLGVVADANWSRRMLQDAAVVFVWYAVRERMTYKYGARAFRYMHLDSGHVCQNLYLGGEAVGCGVCGVGGFYDDRVNLLFGLDGLERFVIYMASVGKKP